MKKYLNIIAIFLVIVCLSLCACGKKSLNGSKNNDFLQGFPSEYYFASGNENNAFLSDLNENAQEKFTVTINANNGSLINVYTVNKGDTVAKPETPVYDDNIFLGWFANGKEYDFSTPVTQDLNIVALWEKVYSSELFSVIGAVMPLANGYQVLGNNATILANDSEGFDRGSIEVTVTSPNVSDSGIILCLDTNGKSTYWENEVSYYFFFVNI